MQFPDKYKYLKYMFVADLYVYKLVPKANRHAENKNGPGG